MEFVIKNGAGKALPEFWLEGVTGDLFLWVKAGDTQRVVLAINEDGIILRNIGDSRESLPFELDKKGTIKIQ